MKGEVLFSVTRKDLRVDYFCTGGPGGQKQNKTASGCRITHEASGAVGESRNHRSQGQNQREAFERLVASEKFQRWVKIQTAAREQGFRDAEAMVDRMMTPDKIRVEVGSGDGVWRQGS